MKEKYMLHLKFYQFYKRNLEYQMFSLLDSYFGSFNFCFSLLLSVCNRIKQFLMTFSIRRSLGNIPFKGYFNGMKGINGNSNKSHCDSYLAELDTSGNVKYFCIILKNGLTFFCINN